MKHKHSNRILGRVAHHRHALLQNLTSELLEHGSIVTTEAKAKELRRFFEPLITRAKKDLTIHHRRVLLSQLRRKNDLEKLVGIAKQQQSRSGGYTRLTRIPSTRHDNASMVRIDILGAPLSE